MRFPVFIASKKLTRRLIYLYIYVSVRIRSFSGLCFSAFRLNTEIYSVNHWSHCYANASNSTEHSDKLLTVSHLWSPKPHLQMFSRSAKQQCSEELCLKVSLLILNRHVHTMFANNNFSFLHISSYPISCHGIVS